MPAPALRDSAGSGDWCSAGFLAKMRGEGVEDGLGLGDVGRVREALRFGQALAALYCAYDGARGLMYAMSRVQVHRAAQRLLANETPRLAVLCSPQPRRRRAVTARVSCAPRNGRWGSLEGRANSKKLPKHSRESVHWVYVFDGAIPCRWRFLAEGDAMRRAVGEIGKEFQAYSSYMHSRETALDYLRGTLTDGRAEAAVDGATM